MQVGGIIFQSILSLFIFCFTLYARDIPEVIGVCGDSISRAFNTGDFPFVDAPHHSWATGYDPFDSVFSHYERLMEIYDTDRIIAYNFAISGAKSADFPRQATKMSEKNPDYVMVFTGNNDLCRRHFNDITPLVQFEENIRSGLDILIKKNEDIKILLVSLPDHLGLVDAGIIKGCNWLREELRICTVIREDMTDQEVKDFIHISDSYDRVLQKLAEYYSDNVIYSEGIKHLGLIPDYISPLDCFHPTRIAQGIIAEVTWSEGFWELTAK